jgi:hypothetical protein
MSPGMSVVVGLKAVGNRDFLKIWRSPGSPHKAGRAPTQPGLAQDEQLTGVMYASGGNLLDQVYGTAVSTALDPSMVSI